MKGVYNIPSGVSFVDALAAGVLHDTRGEPAALDDTLILVPTRRASRSLREAFLRQSDGHALILPAIRPIGDVDEDELTVSLAGEHETGLDILPAITPLRRQLLLARQIRNDPEFGVTSDEQAAKLAEALASFIDEVDTAEVSMDRLDTLVEGDLAEHWQTTLVFLRRVVDGWHQQCTREERLDPARRRRMLLDTLNERWRLRPPHHPVIAAGSTGSIPSTARLLARIAALPHGAVVLPGLDRELDEAAWDAIEASHPQHGLKTLLDHIGIERKMVTDWGPLPDSGLVLGSPARRRLLSDALRPPLAEGPAVANTADAISGLELAACANPREEAQVAALRMRIALEEPERTVALVTRDRSIARRVASELRRWNIDVDDSAGMALGAAPAGVFFRLLARALAANWAPVPVLALLKHPFLRLGRDPAEIRPLVRRLERRALRGPRPAPGIDGLRDAVDENADLQGFLDEISSAIGGFAEQLATQAAPLALLIEAHGRAFEALARPADASTGSIWQHDDGEALHSFVAEMRDHAGAFGLIQTEAYPALLDTLMAQRVVRPRFGKHPRAFIWGPLEARMQHADCVILSGLVEGNWPPEPPHDPWLSRPMRRRFGLDTPEQRIGLAAHDFVQAASAANVLLLYSERADGAPTVPARWLVRLRARLDACGLARETLAGATLWRRWQTVLDRPPLVEPVEQPQPRPPIEDRPRNLSVTQIALWQRNPYAIYARHVLGLRPLDEIDEDADAAMRGSFIHEALERFVTEFPDNLPSDALDRLLDHGRNILGPMLERPVVAAFWWQRFEHIAGWFVEEERRRRDRITRIVAETSGSLEIDDGSGGRFRLTAKADRLEIGDDGRIAVVDYKTGAPPTRKDVISGMAPQLPLEAAMVEAGGFEDLEQASVASLEHWKLTGGHIGGKITTIADETDQIARDARDGLQRLVSIFARPETAYLDHPAGEPVHRFDPYLDVARTNEWRLGWGQPLDDVAFVDVPESGTPRPRASDPRQQAMSDPNMSVWVAASAGTGKTKVLTDRVLRLLLDGNPPSRILCLTFTRAAAAEMANRIRQELAGWSAMDNTDLRTDLTALTGSEPDDDVMARARILFAATLDAPGGLQIATIHSFCQSLLGRFPLEAGIAPHFGLIEDRARSELLQAARDSVIGRIAAGRAPALRSALDRLLLEAGEGRASALLQEICDSAAAFDHMLRRYGTLDEALRALAMGLQIDPDQTDRDVVAKACRDREMDGDALRRAAEALSGGGKTDIEAADAIAPFLAAAEADRPDFFHTYASAFLKRDWTPGSRPVGSKAVRESHPDLAEALDGERERLALVFERLKAFETFERTRAVLVLGADILTDFRRMKAAMAMLDYDDMIEHARALLSKPDIAPWVLFKLDGGIDHVLVDEAQDTNSAQWDVILKLTEEFFDGAGDRERPRTIFVVGDEKQSIFSFQGADLDAFQAVRRTLEERAAPGTWLADSLDLSFRSVPAILNLVDAVFDSPEASSGVVFRGETIRHESFRKEDGGMVEVWPVLHAETPELGDPWTRCLDSSQPRDHNTRLAAAMAQRIAELTGADGGPGEILASRGDTVRAGDVLVLVRRRSDFVTALVRELRRAGVAVAGVDRMDLTGEIVVRDLLALGRLCLLPEDDLSLASVLKGPFVGFDDDLLFQLATNRQDDTTLWQTLRQRRNEAPAFDRAASWIESLLSMTDLAAPFDFFDRLLTLPCASAEGFNGRKALIHRLGLEAQDPLDEFLNLALAYERDHAPSLQGFVWWISSGTAEVKREAETAGDTVRIMTVHGCKGLQAPVVFLVDDMGRDRSGPSIHWDPRVLLPLWVGAAAVRTTWGDSLSDARSRKAAEEERRLLYVALTRPRDRLYVCAAQKGSNEKLGTWHDMIAKALSGLDGRASVAVPFDGEAWRLTCPQVRPVDLQPVGPDRDVAIVNLPSEATMDLPAERAIDRPISPSRLTGAEALPRSPLGERDDGAALKRGRLVHRLLELLPPVPLDRRTAAAGRLITSHAPELSDTEQRDIADRVLALLDDPAYAFVFGPGSRAEVAVSGVLGEMVVAGQIDRLAVSHEKVAIIDFKTGRNAPDVADKTPVAYLKQLAGYRELVRLIYKDRSISCSLLWTDIPSLVEIPSSLLDTHRLPSWQACTA
ncbi:MAG: double-strand break repair helicase AddA [Rhodospirillales bacterium]|nr:double-strand break repair helicase AddA [Rhodospirillales bacterium]